MIFGYKLEEIRKAAVAFVVALVAIAGMFATLDPNTTQAAVAVVVALFNVVSVFLASNHTLDDVSKAVQALQASSLGLITLFVTLDPGVVEAVAAIVLAFINVYGVWRVRNNTHESKIHPS